MANVTFKKDVSLCKLLIEVIELNEFIEEELTQLGCNFKMLDITEERIAVITYDHYRGTEEKMFIPYRLLTRDRLHNLIVEEVIL